MVDASQHSKGMLYVVVTDASALPSRSSNMTAALTDGLPCTRRRTQSPRSVSQAISEVVLERVRRVLVLPADKMRRIGERRSRASKNKN